MTHLDITRIALVLVLTSGCQYYNCENAPLDQRVKWVDRCVERLSQDPLSLPTAYTQCVTAAKDLFCTKEWR